MKCCFENKKHKRCIRKDGKIFSLPRKFTKKKCISKKIKGISMTASCAPYKYCKRMTKKRKSAHKR